MNLKPERHQAFPVALQSVITGYVTFTKLDETWDILEFLLLSIVKENKGKEETGLF